MSHANEHSAEDFSYDAGTDCEKKKTIGAVLRKLKSLGLLVLPPSRRVNLFRGQMRMNVWRIVFYLPRTDLGSNIVHKVTDHFNVVPGHDLYPC
jgi:hypothetical protein